ncbi:MAG: DUF2845 domain-containing protein [Deltaproteobacteria bacterium]|jgi:hypothetical protein|nr:DUF2845 domain-containing protein [Deltaproteobacteria bacterium]
MKLTAVSLLIIFSLVFGYSTQVSAIGLRCGNRLITVGDTKLKVISECGIPDYKEEWIEERIMKDFNSSAYYKKDYEWGREPFLVKTLVKMEEWYYNFGPTRLIHYLRFRNGKLIKITIGERGY